MTQARLALAGAALLTVFAGGLGTLVLGATPAAGLKPPDPASISLAVLPEGPNRALVVERCAVCHPIEQVVAQRRTPEDWQRQVPRMVGFGAVASEDEQDLILDYLETVFGK
jgi:hypothetical protein